MSSRLHTLLVAERLIAIDKPAGLLSVPGRGADKQDCVASRARAMFPDATGPMIVHRLDMETSGVMILALDADAHRDLSGQFERREIDKTYIAELKGAVEEEQGVITLPIRADIEHRPHQIVDLEHGRPSKTRWRVLERSGAGDDRRTRIEFRPVTGRTHQLRVHAAASRPGGLGAPIVGDSLYAADGSTAPRMLLHATRLEVTSPGGDERLIIESPAPF